jgi:isoleucyl-tRNA synthetase
MQAKSRAYATEQIEPADGRLQAPGRARRLGHPYRTMDFANEAGELRAFKRVIERGFVYRGLKPVYWCFDCGSSLAEFEIEYQDKKSFTIDVGFKCAEPEKLRGVRPAVAGQGRRCRDLDDHAVDDPRQPGAEPQPAARIQPGRHRARPAAARLGAGRKCLERYGLEGTVVATTLGQSLDEIRFRHPLAEVDPGYDRLSPIYLADYATADDGTGIVHSSPAYGVDDFNSCVSHGMKIDDILNPVQGSASTRRAAAVRRPVHLEGAAGHHRRAARRRPLFATREITHSYPHCWRHKTPVIYRAAAQWFVRMDEGEGVFTKDKAPATLRQLALAGDRPDDRVLSGERQGAPARHDRRPPDWCISASAAGACRSRSSCTRIRASCIRARWRSSTRPPTSSRRAASRPGAA